MPKQWLEKKQQAMQERNQEKKATPKLLFSPRQELCKCGRTQETPHCPNCGCRSIYKLDSASRATKIQGEVYLVQGCRCTRCGQEFQIDSPCGAPDTKKVSKKVVEIAEMLMKFQSKSKQ